MLHGESKTKLEVQRGLSAQNQELVYLSMGCTTAKQSFISFKFWTEAAQNHCVNLCTCC